MNKLLFRAVFFCLSVLSLSSCRQDDETDRSNESVDLVAVNIPIEGVRVESADSPLTRAGSVNTLTVTEELEDGFVLETSLMPVSAGLTRAAITTGLASDVQILAIAYKESGELYKYQYFTPGSPIIHLPKGERFKLVFYSYNSTTKPDISRDITGSVSPVTNGAIFSKNASLNDKSESHKNNVMWGRIDLTPVITSGTILSGVTFTHLFSRLDWQLRSVVGTITECSGSVRNTYENGTIKLGNLVNVSGGSNGNDTWIGAGNADYATSVKFATSNSMDITSSKTVFCPNAGATIRLGLENITVGDKTFTNKSYTFSTELKRGVDYRVESTIKRRMTVTFRAASGGRVTLEGAQTATAYGERFESTALANTGYIFDGWYRIEDSGEVKLEHLTPNEEVNGTTLVVTVNAATEGRVYKATFRRDVPNIEWAPANLMYKNGRYLFENVPLDAPFNAGAFFVPNKRKPDDGVTKNMGRVPSTKWTWDPCAEMGGGWRLPTKSEVQKFTWWWWRAPSTHRFETLYAGPRINPGGRQWDFGTPGCYSGLNAAGGEIRWLPTIAPATTGSSLGYGNVIITLATQPKYPFSDIYWYNQPNIYIRREDNPRTNNIDLDMENPWTYISSGLLFTVPATVRCVRDK